MFVLEKHLQSLISTLSKPITVVDNEQDEIRLANGSLFGLGSSIWDQDLDKAEKLSKLLEVGIVTVNNVVISDPRIPFGGVKNYLDMEC